MFKTIIDTNVIVSALIQKNYPYFIIMEMLFEERFILCLSNELMQEYIDVLSRPKFQKYPDFTNNAESIIHEIGLKAELFYPKIKIDIISDKDDNKILELADECKADFIITGNTNDFTFSQYKNTRIVSPEEFWELLN